MELSLSELFAYLVGKNSQGEGKEKAFYAQVLNALDKVPVEGFGTMGVGIQSNRVVLYYDPAFLKRYSFKLCVMAVEHEALHLVLDHIPRYLELLSHYVDEETRKKYNAVANIAMDCADNSLLRKDAEWKDVKDEFPFCLPELYGMEDNQPYEYYHHDLSKKAKLFKVKIKVECTCPDPNGNKQYQQQQQQQQQQGQQGQPQPQQGQSKQAKDKAKDGKQGEGQKCEDKNGQNSSPDAKTAGQGQQGQQQQQGQQGQQGQGGGGSNPQRDPNCPMHGDHNKGQGGGKGKGGGGGMEFEVEGVSFDGLAKDFNDRTGNNHQQWTKGVEEEGNPKDGSGKRGVNDLSPEELQSIADRIREQAKNVLRKAVAEHTKARGTIPSGLEEILNEYLKEPIMPWYQLLTSMIKVTQRSKPIRGIVRPNRTLLGISEEDPKIMPGIGKQRDPKFRIFFAIDTSGSMSTDSLIIAMSEIQHLLDADDDIEVRVLMCDADVSYDKLFKHGEDLPKEVYGRGGTDFNPVFAHIKEKYMREDKSPDMLIYYTDGYCTAVHPKLRLPYAIPVVWLLSNDSHSPDPFIQDGYGTVLVCTKEANAIWKYERERKKNAQDV